MNGKSELPELLLKQGNRKFARLFAEIDGERGGQSRNLSGHGGGGDDACDLPCVAGSRGAAAGCKQSAGPVGRIERPIGDLPDKSRFAPVGQQSDGVVEMRGVLLVLEHVFSLDAVDLPQLRNHRKFERITAPAVEFSFRIELLVIFQQKVAGGENVLGDVLPGGRADLLGFQRGAGEAAFRKNLFRNGAWQLETG